MTGRPRTEMTPENIEKILKAVSLGMWPDRAAEMHGISKSAMRMHKKRDPNFVTALKEAEATAEGSTLSRMLRHQEDQWTACAWMLERRWPERWAKRDQPLNASDAKELVRRLRDAAVSLDGMVPEAPKETKP